MTQRKYSMTRIGSGDYLLPSNDAQTIWRLRRYEDGPSHGLDWPADRQVWCVERWTGELGPACLVDTDPASERWEAVATTLPTRRAAIETALTS